MVIIPHSLHKENNTQSTSSANDLLGSRKHKKANVAYIRYALSLSFIN